ncbi:MAG: hypothetical protein HY685_03160 [Chloroflexi bacterium]|nr:hypothetical protein [Chloroflexota bacterium]
MRLSRIPVIALGILFLLSLVGIFLGWSIPTMQERTVIQTTYKMEGKLDHTAFGHILNPEEEQKRSAQGKYFANLLKAVDVGYTYQFVPSRPATGRDVEQVQISAILESTGLWEKEVVLVPQTRYEGGADLTFRLDTASLQDLASRISRQLGVGNPSPYITLKATVQVEALTDSGPLTDTYTQTIRVGVVGSTLEWSAPLESSQKGYYKGLAYDHQGAFRYTLYLKPSLAFGTIERDEEGSFALAGLASTVEAKTPDPVFFTKIVDTMSVSYRYELLAQDLNAQSAAQITAVLENPGLWQKEVVIVPLATYTGPFSIDIPLDIAALQSTAAKINQELGIPGGVKQFLLKATVRTSAQTASGAREADFVQTTRLIPDTATLTWQRGLTKSEMATWDGVSYEQKGKFDYAIRLKDNILFGPITLRPDEEGIAGEGQGTEGPLPGTVLTSPAASADALEPLAVAKTYQKNSVERIDVKFDFPFTADPPASSLTQEVEITGVLKGTSWQETLTLVPPTPLSKDFTVAFPLDLPLLYAIIDFNQRQHPEPAAAWDLILSARVHAKANTAFGPIDDQLTQPLTLKMSSTEIAWPDATPQVKEGDIHRTALQPNNSASAARMGSLGVTGMVGVALAFVGWHYVEARRRRLSELESEALQLRGKYKELLLDVQDLPQRKDGTLVELNSMEAVIKTSEALLKPVLHITRPTKHTYAVLDDAIWYVYVHEVAATAPEPGTPAEDGP